MVGLTLELQSRETTMVLWGNLDIRRPGAVGLNGRLMGPRRAGYEAEFLRGSKLTMSGTRVRELRPFPTNAAAPAASEASR